jgi:hypothetical protein
MPDRPSEPTTSRQYGSAQEIETYRAIVKALNDCPIPSQEILANVGLFLTHSTLSQLLFMHALYQRIIPVHGVLVEFGVRWGRNLALLTALRSIYEPYNLSRKIVGFDSFRGFPSVSEKDGGSETATEGALGVTTGYKRYLETLLDHHQQLGHRGHIKRFELVEGDVIETLPRYLDEHPETIIAFAYFDLDLYEPTKKSLERIKKHVTKGSVIAFDQLNLEEYPGETVALREVWGTHNLRIERSPIARHQSFAIIE